MYCSGLTQSIPWVPEDVFEHLKRLVLRSTRALYSGRNPSLQQPCLLASFVVGQRLYERLIMDFPDPSDQERRTWENFLSSKSTYCLAARYLLTLRVSAKAWMSSRSTSSVPAVTMTFWTTPWRSFHHPATARKGWL